MFTSAARRGVTVGLQLLTYSLSKEIERRSGLQVHYSDIKGLPNPRSFFDKGSSTKHWPLSPKLPVGDVTPWRGEACMISMEIMPLPPVASDILIPLVANTFALVRHLHYMCCL